MWWLYFNKKICVKNKRASGQELGIDLDREDASDVLSRKLFLGIVISLMLR